MYDKKIREMEEALDASEQLIGAATEVIEKLSEEVADLKEKNKIMRSDIVALGDDSFSSELLASAIREIQDEMKRKNNKLILIHEV
jgi:FtsZ-binding cell division protein ZapB